MPPFLESWAACCLVAQSRPTLCDPTDSSMPGSSVHGDSPDKNTVVGCHFLLQGIFLTPGTSPQAVKPLRHRAGKKVVGGLAVPLAATGAPRFPPAHGQGCVWSCGSDTIWERARRPPQAAEGTGSYSRLGRYALPELRENKVSFPPTPSLSLCWDPAQEPSFLWFCHVLISWCPTSLHQPCAMHTPVADFLPDPMCAPSVF